MNLHGDIDAHTVEKRFDQSCGIQEMDTTGSVESIIDNIKVWVDTKRLKMNSSKIEFILFGYTKQIDKCLVT